MQYFQNKLNSLFEFSITSIIGIAFIYLLYFSNLSAQTTKQVVNCRQELSSKNYIQLRGGLKNCYIQFEKGKNGKVAFLGGSITNMKGWRDMVCNFLKQRFPETEFEFINAGIPSTGSVPGAFRLERDVLSKGKIDLLFEEAAVNDATNGRSSVEQIRGMEGIVRHVLMVNPNMDIVLLYFVDPEKMAEYNSGREPDVIRNHEKVADYYNVPSINLALEVTERINNEEFTWAEDFKDLHPSPFGHQLYLNSIKTLFEIVWPDEAVKDYKIIPHTIPDKKLDSESFDNGKFLPLTRAEIVKGFKLIRNWNPTDDAGTRNGFVRAPALIAENPGAELKFLFKGTAVGIFAAAGPDAGKIEYKIDDELFVKLDLFTKWSKGLHLPWLYLLAAGLENQEHILTLRTSDDKNEDSRGNACRIFYFVVNEAK
ncbi:hypothetical protein H8E88_09260 [candidate division KSB1 bacterium]|nr:hypothetical protein [candidate division KSB1 bacterium]